MSPLSHAFFKTFLPVLGIIEILKSLKYQLQTLSSSEFMAFLKNDKLMMIRGGTAEYINFLDNFLKYPLVLKILLGMFFNSRNSKMTSKLP